MTKTAAERKRLQRRRDRALGWREILIKIPAGQEAYVRDFVADLPPPKPPTDPNQLDFIEQIEREISSKE